MSKIDKLFFELIRVAIGTQVCLSRTPSATEWQTLYDMALKQSLVGICFAGVQKLQAQQQAPPEMLYLQWMGMAAKIQQRNEVINRRCVDVQKRIETAGYRSLILKGQGLAASYYGNLAMLRQSGDIDVWVLPDEGDSYDEHFRKVMAYSKTIGEIEDFNRQHVSVPFFSDTEVELHFIPSLMNDPLCNKRLQKWFAVEVRGERLEVRDSSVSKKCSNHSILTANLNFNVPSVEFNLVYLLQHCYNHLLFEGVGLRQIMDYYFVLRTVSDGYKFQEVSGSLKDLGLLRFASAMMWVLQYVFGLDKEYLIVDPNEKEGRFLLDEIVNGGNFGKYGKDGVMEGHAQGKLAFFFARMRRNLRFLSHYPNEILWSPYAMFGHWVWKQYVKL